MQYQLQNFTQGFKDGFWFLWSCEEEAPSSRSLSNEPVESSQQELRRITAIWSKRFVNIGKAAFILDALSVGTYIIELSSGNGNQALLSTTRAISLLSTAVGMTSWACAISPEWIVKKCSRVVSSRSQVV